MSLQIVSSGMYSFECWHFNEYYVNILQNTRRPDHTERSCEEERWPKATKEFTILKNFEEASQLLKKISA